MTTPIDIGSLINNMKSAATEVLNHDITTLDGFSERQMEAIAQQAKLVALGIANGGITEETRDFFLDSLKDMTRNFVKTLAGLAAVTIEKIWNAMVSVLWKAIGSATGLQLPAPE